MSSTDEKIGTILAQYGVPADGSVWRVEGQAFIHHRALERIAAQAKITFDPPTVLRRERDEAVLLVLGRMGERVEWSIGEATVGVNYEPLGSEPAYVYAMAEKRAKDRVILKLIQLHDVIPSEEPQAVESRPRGSNENTPAAERGMEPSIVLELELKLGGCEAVEAVIALTRDPQTQQSLAALPQDVVEQVRKHAKARMVAPGWGPKRVA
jgi:hypothetical protein